MKNIFKTQKKEKNETQDKRFPVLIWMVFGVLFMGVLAIAMPVEANEVIDGNSVYINDTNAYIRLTPHTVNNPSWVEAEFKIKEYSGFIDFTFGFNQTSAYPSALQIYDYVSGNWTNWNVNIGLLQYNYDGFDKWYYVLNQFVNANQTYKIRFWLDVRPYTSGKYGFAIKPSGYTIEQSINGGYFYYIDPWFNIDACGTLDTINSVYNLTENVNSTGTCFSIANHSITLDCRGYSINFSQSGGANTYGIYSNGYTNLTIKNCNVFTDFESVNDDRHGIYFNNVNNSVIEYNNATAGSSSYGGIYLSTSSNNTLTSNTGTSGTYGGIRLHSSSNYNTLTLNTGTSGTDGGIYLYSSSNYNTLTSNTGTSGTSGGILLHSSSNYNTLTSNTGTSGTDGGIYLSTSSNNTLTSNTGTSGTYGGIRLHLSSNNTLTSNTGTSGTDGGIRLSTSSNYNTLTSNIGTATTTWDFYIKDSSYNIFDSNIYEDDTYLDNSIVKFYGLVNALLYNNTNLNIYGSSTINNNDGNVNITAYSPETAYVFDDYKIDETQTRQNDPISITGTSTQKTITSTLADTINVTGVIDVGSEVSKLRGITVYRPSGDNTSYSSGWNDLGGGIYQFELINIEGGVTTLKMDVTTCTYWENVMSPIIMIVITLGVLAGCMWFLKGDLDFENKEWKNLTLRNLILTFIFIMISMAFIVAISDSLAGRCVL